MLDAAIRIHEYKSNTLLHCLIGFCGTVNLSKLIHAWVLLRIRLLPVLSLSARGRIRRWPQKRRCLTLAVQLCPQPHPIALGSCGHGTHWHREKLFPMKTAVLARRALPDGRERCWAWEIPGPNHRFPIPDPDPNHRFPIPDPRSRSPIPDPDPGPLSRCCGATWRPGGGGAAAPVGAPVSSGGHRRTQVSLGRHRRVQLGTSELRWV